MSQFEALLKLGLTEAEAKQVLEDDKKIDRGEKMPFDLTKEQEKETRKYRQADRKPFVPNLKQRERKPNEPKREIISRLNDCLIDFILEDANIAPENHQVVITNPERQIDFCWNGVKYRIVLSAPRK